MKSRGDKSHAFSRGHFITSPFSSQTKSKSTSNCLDIRLPYGAIFPSCQKPAGDLKKGPTSSFQSKIQPILPHSRILQPTRASVSLELGSEGAPCRSAGELSSGAGYLKGGWVRLTLSLTISEAHQYSRSIDRTFGSTKIRTTENRYTWRKTTAVGPVQDPGPIFNDAAAGSLRIHEYKGGLQVWVLDTVKAGTTIKYHWTVPTQGSAHPTLPAYFLHIKDQKMPSWVLRSTINTYASRQKRASANSPAPTEDSLGGGGQRVTRFRLNAAAGGL